jgi:hypothetical protein
VSQAFKHFSYAAFKVETHNQKRFWAGAGSRDDWTVTEICSGTPHTGFVETRIWKTEQPDLVNFASANPVEDIKILQDLRVINGIGLVETGAGF